jgi:hypothetical protein
MALWVKQNPTIPPIGGIVETLDWLKTRACPPVLWRAGARKGADPLAVNRGLDLAGRAENGGNLGRAIPHTHLLFLKISPCSSPDTCLRAATHRQAWPPTTPGHQKYFPFFRLWTGKGPWIPPEYRPFSHQKRRLG